MKLFSYSGPISTGNDLEKEKFQGSYLGSNGERKNFDGVVQSMVIKEKDYIRNVMGIGGSEGISFLRLETEGRECFEVGDEEKEGDLFELNIRNFDVPVILFGALEPKKSETFIF